MLSGFRNVLVLSPHTDDGELGAGGTIAKLTEAGANVHYAAFSTAEESVPVGLPRDILKTEVRAATKQLDIPEDNIFIYNYRVRKLNYSRQEVLEDLVTLRSKTNYDLVLVPSLSDVHQDHSTVAQEALRAFKATTILSYELIWNNLNFNTACFVVLDKANVEKKIAALAEYKSQSGRAYMSAEFILSLAKARGVQIGAPYAEAFEVVRWVMRS
ncbi:MAG: PIG-L deacetylase family protein [Rhizobiaceae bacterium]